MDAMRGYLEKLGGNFLVAAMIPSLGFVVAVLTAFDPLLRISESYARDTGISHLFDFWVLLTIPTAIIGFTLTALNTYILKVYEGYVFLRHFSWMKKAQIKKAKQLAAKRKRLRKKIEAIERRNPLIKFTDEKTKRLWNDLKDQYYVAAAEYDNAYPASLKNILPTEFGNILRASETYPGTRYGIDGVMLWPRLFHVIPPSYKNLIELSRNELSFLVNLSLLCTLFTILCGLAILYTIFFPLLIVLFPAQPISYEIPYALSYQYTLLGALASFLGLFFQRASLFSVREFGDNIRSSYDLFRMDLLQKFYLTIPPDSSQEYEIWKNLNERIVLGPQHSLDITPLYYDLTLKKNQQEE